MDYKNGLNYSNFYELVDNMYDELLIYDGNYNIVYINKACRRHYGCNPDKMIGRSFYDFISAEWWDTSILPIVYKEKKSYAIKQTTYIGSELLTIATPIFDNQNNVIFVVMNVRDNISDVDLWNSQSSPVKYAKGEMTPIFVSSEMKNVEQQINRAAQLGTPCIFHGEVGVGKTMMARYYHSVSARSDQAFATFDCKSVSSAIADEELFGRSNYPGLLYKMRNGTLLLKNISGLSLELQHKLLDFFEDDNNYSQWTTQKCQILATTDVDLQALIKNGQFLEKLYFLLNVFEIYIPPLRKRRDDIAPLISHLCASTCAQYKLSKRFTDGAIHAMEKAEWPRNIMELRHTIERLVATTPTTDIETTDLPEGIFGILDSETRLTHTTDQNFDKRIEEYESYLVRDAYQKYGTSRKMAQHLGISQTKANNLIRKYIRAETSLL